MTAANAENRIQDRSEDRKRRWERLIIALMVGAFGFLSLLTYMTSRPPKANPVSLAFLALGGGLLLNALLLGRHRMVLGMIAGVAFMLSLFAGIIAQRSPIVQIFLWIWMIVPMVLALHHARPANATRKRR